MPFLVQRILNNWYIHLSNCPATASENLAVATFIVLVACHHQAAKQEEKRYSQMDFSNEETIMDIIQKLKNIDYINPEDIPNIDLYMDQVTTFMDEHLAACKRMDDDKILTKTMINNYTKNDFIPPTIKKKY